MTQPAPVRLVLDEMFSPRLASLLRERGHDVVAVADQADVRAMTDDHLFALATAESRWLVTENGKDCRPIMMRALQTGGATTGLLFTSSRTFPRSRQNLGPLFEALQAWLAAGPPPSHMIEDWLLKHS